MKFVPLGSQPEIAREIGLLFMHVSNLEVMSMMILEAIVGEIAQVIWVKVDNLAARLSILYEIARAYPNDPLAAAVAEAQVDIEKATSLRNKLAHSLYVFNDSGQLILCSNAMTERRGRVTYLPLTAQLVSEHTNTLANAIARIAKVGGDRLRNPFDAVAR